MHLTLALALNPVCLQRQGPIGSGSSCHTKLARMALSCGSGAGPASRIECTAWESASPSLAPAHAQAEMGQSTAECGTNACTRPHAQGAEPQGATVHGLYERRPVMPLTCRLQLPAGKLGVRLFCATHMRKNMRARAGAWCAALGEASTYCEFRRIAGI